jgi:hypothetical protein
MRQGHLMCCGGPGARWSPQPTGKQAPVRTAAASHQPRGQTDRTNRTDRRAPSQRCSPPLPFCPVPPRLGSPPLAAVAFQQRLIAGENEQASKRGTRRSDQRPHEPHTRMAVVSSVGIPALPPPCPSLVPQRVSFRCPCSFLLTDSIRSNSSPLVVLPLIHIQSIVCWNTPVAHTASFFLLSHSSTARSARAQANTQTQH